MATKKIKILTQPTKAASPKPGEIDQTCKNCANWQRRKRNSDNGWRSCYQDNDEMLTAIDRLMGELEMVDGMVVILVGSSGNGHCKNWTKKRRATPKNKRKIDGWID